MYAGKGFNIPRNQQDMIPLKLSIIMVIEIMHAPHSLRTCLILLGGGGGGVAHSPFSSYTYMN